MAARLHHLQAPGTQSEEEKDKRSAAREALFLGEETQAELGDDGSQEDRKKKKLTIARSAVQTPPVKAKTGRAKRRQKRLRNEPQNVTGEGPSGIHVLDFVEARALEMSSLMKALGSKGASKRAFQELPRHMRRRAMSHNIKRLPRRLREVAKREMEKSKASESASQKKQRPSRKQKRKLKVLREEYTNRQRDKKWLETHLWHAKRMRMVERYGFRLAENVNDKGVRAAYKSLVYGCLLSDVSYYCCIEVIAQLQSDVIAAINPLFSSESGLTLRAKSLLKGQREGKAIVYKSNSYPHGAIGPVQFLWQSPTPQEHCEVRSTTGVDHVKLWVWSHPAIHDELLRELQGVVDDYLKSPIVSNSQQDGDSSVSLSVRSLKLDLVRFRLIGPRSHALLVETLKPSFQFRDNDEGSTVVSSSLQELPEGFNWWKKYLPTIAQQKVLSQAYPSIKLAPSPAHFPRGTVVGMTVIDPRLFTPSKRTDMVSAFYPPKKELWAAVCGGLPQANTNGFQRDGPFERETDDSYSDESGEDGDGCDGGEGGEAENVTDQDIEKMLVDSEDDGMVSDHDDDDDTIPPVGNIPVPSSQIFIPELPLELAYSALWNDEVRELASKCKIHERHLNSLRSKYLVKQSELKLGEKAARIPVMMVQQSLNLPPIVAALSSSSGENDFRKDPNLGTGWDLILPKEWAMPFWVSLVYRGARACGMKELKKCSLESLTLDFPQDFPDTKAGMDHSATIRATLEARYIRYPPDKRRNFGKLLIQSPFHSPWGDLIDSWQKRSLSTKQSGEVGLASYEELLPEAKRARIEVVSCEDLIPEAKPQPEVEVVDKNTTLVTSSSNIDPPLAVKHATEKSHLDDRDAILPVSEDSASIDYYILRSKDTLRTLHQFIDHLFALKKKQQLLLRKRSHNPTTPTASLGQHTSSTSLRQNESSFNLPSSLALESGRVTDSQSTPSSHPKRLELVAFLKQAFREFDIDQLLQAHSRALVAVRFEMLQGGSVTDRATLSLPASTDLCTLVTLTRERPFSGPRELMHPKGMTVVEGNQISVGVSALTRKQVNEVKVQRKVFQRSQKKESANVLKSAVEDFKLLPANPSRVAIGYATSAGYRLHSSKSGGCGFVTLGGLIETVGRCFSEPCVCEVMCLARGETIHHQIVRLQVM